MDKRILTLTGGFLTAFILFAVLITWMHGCDRSPVVTPNVNKEQIKQDKIKRDSVKIRVDTVYKLREKIVYKWKEHRNDSLIPCHIKLKICDTIIYVDSTLISELKQVIQIDNLIIEGQDKVIRADSLAIRELQKDVRKQKRRKNIMAVLAVIAAGLAISK